MLYVSVCIGTAIWGQTFHHGEAEEVAMVEVVTMACYVSTAMIGTLCIFLMFKVNHIEYHTLCSWCDSKCAVLCQWIAANQRLPQTVVQMAMTASRDKMKVERSEGIRVDIECDSNLTHHRSVLPMPLVPVASVSSPESSGDLEASYAIV